MTVEFPVRFHIDVGLQRSRRDDETNLRPHANDPGFKGAETISGVAIRRDLFIEITDRADLNLLGQELRGAPIQMPVNAALIVCAGVDKIIREPCYRGEFMTCHGIEIRIASSKIGGSMPDAEVGKAGGIVLANGYVATIQLWTPSFQRRLATG